MGSGQSARATHFQRPDAEDVVDEDDDEEPHISISNKMVERLVEDASISSRPPKPQQPQEDVRDQIFAEKLRALDDKHTQRWGLTVDEINALATRVDRRTANMASAEPVCEYCEQQVMDCLSSSGGEGGACWEAVEAFKTCVRHAVFAQLSARARRDAREHARRSRHVARARENVLRDLGEREREEATAA